MKSGFILIRRT